MTDFKLPDLGEGLPDAEIVEWLVSEGDSIEEGQSMVEMSTAKAVVEVPAPFSGTVVTLHGKPGDVIETGAVLITIAEEGAEDDADETSQSEAGEADAPDKDETNGDGGEVADGDVFLLPDLGEGLPDAEIVKWLVGEGDSIEEGEAMVEMSTAKAVVEVPAPHSGRVKKLFGAPGDVIETGKPLIEIETDKGPERKKGKKKEAAGPGGSEKEERKEKPGAAATVVGAVEVGEDVTSEATLGSDGIRARSAVRAFARKQKLDLSKIEGTGKDGEITFADVRAAREAPPEQGKAPGGGSDESVDRSKAEVAAGPSARNLADSLGIDLSQAEPTGPRGAITKQDVITAARARLGPSKAKAAIRGEASLATGKGVRAAPKVRAFARDQDIDLGAVRASGPADNVTMGDVERALEEANEALGRDFKPLRPYRRPQRSYEVSGEPERLSGPRRVMAQAMAKAASEVCHTSLFDEADIESWPEKTDITVRIMRAVIAASMVEPGLNAWFDGEKLEKTLHKQVHLGIAVDSPKGLFVPVIKKADSLSPEELRAELQRLRAAIGEGTIEPSDMSGATLTISNFGMIAGRFATPIIMPPQIAIIGIGGLHDRLVLAERRIEQHRQMPLSLTFDHRAATGGEAARFLAAMIEDLSFSH